MKQMVDGLMKKIDDSFLATNKRIDELISVTTAMRDQFSYLKAEYRASNQRLDVLENQVNELRSSK